MKKSRTKPRIRDKKIMAVTTLLDFRKDLSMNDWVVTPQQVHA
jgi:hypothetical protein